MAYTLKQHEAFLTAAALYSVARSGGGSPEFHLANRILTTHNIQPDDKFEALVRRLQAQAAAEFAGEEA